LDIIEAARHRARSTYTSIAALTLLWAIMELLVDHNPAAFAGFLAASLMAWIIRFLLTANGVGQMLSLFEPRGKA